MDDPIVSVILPFRNAEQHLKEAANSILSQSFFNLELILVDNASKDKGWEIATAFARSDQRVVLTREDQVGPAAAFNKGLKLAKGKLIARMDSDDCSLPDRIKIQAEHLQTHPKIDAVYSKIKPLGKTPIGMLRYVAWQNNITEEVSIGLNQFVELPVCNPTLMARKETFEKFGTYSEGCYPEDYELVLRWLEQGATIGKITQPLLLWRDHSHRLTRSHPGYSQHAFFCVKAPYLVRWLKKHAPGFPEVGIWGTGKLAKKRLRILQDMGLKPTFRFDLQEQPGKGIRSYKSLDPNEVPFVLSLVSNRHARASIRAFLNDLKMKEGKQFILAG